MAGLLLLAKAASCCTLVCCYCKQCMPGYIKETYIAGGFVQAVLFLQLSLQKRKSIYVHQLIIRQTLC